MKLFFPLLLFATFVNAQSVTLSGLNSAVIYDKSYNDLTITNSSNIYIIDCTFKNSRQSGIHLQSCNNVVITHDSIVNVMSGVYAQSCFNVVVSGNYMLNMQGPMPQAQFVQFDHCTGGKVVKNYLVNIFGQSNPEDAISMYMSNGTANNPIIIAGNYINGGGPSPTGGGIILGDGGGSYQIAKDNTLVNPGQYGIGIAGGTNMQIINNRIYAVKNTFTNVGITIWNQYSGACAIIVVSGNRVNWTNSAGVSNPFWNAGNCGIISGWGSNIADGTLVLR